MSIIVVANTLSVGNSNIDIQFYNTLELAYEDIVTVEGLESFIVAPDGITLIVTPYKLQGTVNVTVTTTNGIKDFPIYYQTPYERSSGVGSKTQDFYPENMWVYDEGYDSEDHNPKTEENYSVDDTFTTFYSQVGDLVPLANNFNITFPEYCSSQLIGIAMSLATEQYKRELIKKEQDPSYVTNYDWIIVREEKRQNPTASSDLVETCQLLGNPDDEGKYTTIRTLDEKLALLKYGAVQEGNTGKYCRYNKSIKISTPLIIDPRDNPNFFTWDSSVPTQTWDSGIWFSTIAVLPDIFPLDNWQNTQGVPAACEIIYIDNDIDISQLDEAITVPSYSRVILDSYDLLKWLKNKVTNSIIFAIQFDGRDFVIRGSSSIAGQNFLTFDDSTLTHRWDRGVWG
jgi:hypothetical protein